jgi:hypothetical protein
VNTIKVFIAGPRALNILNQSIEGVLARIIEKQLTVLLGDASGVDRLAQQFFAEAKYSNVYVYASNGKARNNLGNWTVNTVEVPPGIKGFDFYAQKDIRMAHDADNGFMIWNGKSKGTLNNMINLTSQSKKVVVYFTPTKQMCRIDSLEDVEKLAQFMGTEILVLYRKLRPKNIVFSLEQNQEQLSFLEV